MGASTQVAAYAARPKSIPEQDSDLTEAEVQQGLRRLDNNRAPGLPAELLKQGGVPIL
jgi:hypothetical protein